MIKNKCKKIVSAMLLMTMIATTFSVDVFAGGGASHISVDCDKHICTGLPAQPTARKSDYFITGSQYSFNEETGELEIRTQDALDYRFWKNRYKNEIKSVKIIPHRVPAESVFKICTHAFDGCTRLESVTIQGDVYKINSYAFSKCESLKEITIPNSVKKIEEYAFSECPNLKSVTYLGKHDLFVDLYEEEFEEMEEESSEESLNKKCVWDDENPVFDNCPIKEVKVPSDYEGTTFCGIKVTKG